VARRKEARVTEDEARAWVAETFGGQSADRLESFGAMVAEENTRQNLISPSTLATIWQRHLLDSAQLMRFCPPTARTWIDVGTGAGFPGVVIGLLFPGEVLLAEPRARRAEFLLTACERLGIASRVRVRQAKAEALPRGAFDVLSARAVASVPALLDMTRHLRAGGSRLILPRGKSGEDELAIVRLQWHGMFHVEQSLSDAESTIIIADGVTR
jgi:16S rRNA (guanine527-N7)-methyltransferase